MAVAEKLEVLSSLYIQGASLVQVLEHRRGRAFIDGRRGVLSSAAITARRVLSGRPAKPRSTRRPAIDRPIHPCEPKGQHSLGGCTLGGNEEIEDLAGVRELRGTRLILVV